MKRFWFMQNAQTTTNCWWWLFIYRWQDFESVYDRGEEQEELHLCQRLSKADSFFYTKKKNILYKFDVLNKNVYIYFSAGESKYQKYQKYEILNISSENSIKQGNFVWENLDSTNKFKNATCVCLLRARNA